jgi:hypothetical protein
VCSSDLQQKYFKNKSKNLLLLIQTCATLPAYQLLKQVLTMHVDHRIRPTGTWERSLIQFITTAFAVVARVLDLPLNVGLRVCRTAAGAHWTRYAARYNHDQHRVEVNVRNIGFRHWGVYLKALVQSSLVAQAYARGYIVVVTGKSGARSRLKWAGPVLYTGKLPRGSRQRYDLLLEAYIEDAYSRLGSSLLDAMGVTADDLAATDGADADTAIVLPNFTPTIRQARADSAYGRYRGADSRGITWYHAGSGPLSGRTVGVTKWVNSPVSVLTQSFRLY